MLLFLINASRFWAWNERQKRESTKSLCLNIWKIEGSRECSSTAFHFFTRNFYVHFCILFAEKWLFLLGFSLRKVISIQIDCNRLNNMRMAIWENRIKWRSFATWKRNYVTQLGFPRLRREHPQPSHGVLKNVPLQNLWCRCQTKPDNYTFDLISHQFKIQFIWVPRKGINPCSSKGGRHWGC